MKLAKAMLLVVGIGVCMMSCARGLVPERRPLRRADVIVVLGNRPPADADGNVMPETRRRVEAGVALYEAGLATQMIMTGGPAPHERIEAEVMRDLAVELGVPEEAIRMESRSRNTIENARFTLEMLCDGPGPCYPSIIVVSSPYHLRRARYLFECAGARVQTAPAEDPGGAYARRFAFSERLVALAYGFVDECRDANPAAGAHAAP